VHKGLFGGGRELAERRIMSVTALIVAAGRGARAVVSKTLIPKQYMPIGGVPMLTRTMGAFTGHPGVDDVIVVIHPDDVAFYDSAAMHLTARLRPPARGGDHRQDSVRSGLEALAATPPDRVLIHDAARPFVDAELIGRVIGGLDTHAGALPCLPVTDTLTRASGGHVTGTLARDELWRAQTPQGFHFDAILAAHRAAAKASATFTDDAGVAQWFCLDVALVEGSEENRKLTSAQDIASADELLRLRAMRAQGTQRVATGYDVHAFGPGDMVILCGVRIPHDKKLVGHSDADVGMHALTDALLGTIADGDIGVHFPPSEARWRGVASEVFLKDAAERLKARGGEIVHVDLTFVCEVPRIGPYRDAMRAKLAECLGLAVGQVSIKATTNEGLGFIGRGEGIAAMATATVRLP
jgi:2-C-methyl-D-erythritol 4-phosphate cytidylyltransferase / 2-C-methyl-D-erythritol 2,4-cyclodiphosphate synthase